jgi:Leu/Phe-tRNA-protein transferase
MNQYEFGYFPRNKYKDLVFYVKTGEHSNMGLFEMEDTEENRALMDALRSHPYQSERDTISKELALELCMDARKDVRDKVLVELWNMIEENNSLYIPSGEIQRWIKELRQQAGDKE